jgi:hypothetical protein
MYLATVRWATMRLRWSNSLWMRVAPHNGLARLMSRMREMVSGALVFRPAFGARLFHFQKKRKHSRCHRMTGLGCTNRSRILHPLQKRESHAQKARSRKFNRGRLGFRVSTRSSRRVSQQSMRHIIQRDPVAAEHFSAGWNYCRRQSAKDPKNTFRIQEFNSPCTGSLAPASTGGFLSSTKFRQSIEEWQSSPVPPS